MSYLIKVPVDLIDYTSMPHEISFIAIKKSVYICQGDEIFVFRETDDFAGLIGVAEVTGSPIKVSDIAKEEQHKIYDRSLMQIPVRFKTISSKSIIDKKILYHLPGLNHTEKIRPYNPNTLYWCSIPKEIDYLLKNNWWYFTHLAYPTDNHWLYWLHIIREKRFSSWTFNDYRKHITGKKKCEICGMKSKPFKEFYHDFFELHETTKIDTDDEYNAIKPENFIVVCPNCHKKEHSKIKNNKKQLKVKFTKTDAGWLCFFVKTKYETYEDAFSHVFDPLYDLKSWLESIALEVQQASFRFDLEGRIHKFDFESSQSKGDYFTITNTEEPDPPLLRCNINGKTLVKKFYKALMKFAKSDKYDPETWEIPVKGQEYGYSGMSLSDFKSEIIEKMIDTDKKTKDNT